MGSESVPGEFFKQPYESMVAYGGFSNVMESGETITLVSSTATALDVNGSDASSDILQGNPAIYNDDDGNPWRLGIRVVAGEASKSPYKITFKILTSLANKWEVDCYVNVEEL